MCRAYRGITEPNELSSLAVDLEPARAGEASGVSPSPLSTLCSFPTGVSSVGGASPGGSLALRMPPGSPKSMDVMGEP